MRLGGYGKDDAVLRTYDHTPLQGPVVVVILFAVTLAAFVTALVPINSNDFWWHLKTGDYIRVTGALPITDPFSWFPSTDTVDPERPGMILRQYWLAQVGYSFMHSAFGLTGIVCLRAVFCAAMVLAAGLFLWRGTRSILSFLPLLPLVLSLRVILEDSDRPQLFAFGAALLVVLLVEWSLRSARRWPLYLLPLLQLVMAQVHPGFAVGTLFVGLYALCSVWEERLQVHRRTFGLIAGLAFLLLFVSPNEARLIPALLGLASITGAAVSLEFQSPLLIWRYVLSEPGWLAYGALFFLSIPTVVWQLRDRCWSRALILFGLTLATLFSMRYIGFFVPISAVVIGLALGQLRLPGWGEHLSAIAVVVLMLMMVAAPGHANRGRIQQLLQPGYFPVRAAEFLADVDFRDHLFNFDAWGGYLEYRLWPRHRIFIDSRVLTNDSSRYYREVVTDTPRGREFMREQSVNTVIFPPIDIYNGEIFPLVRRLATDPQWDLVHFDDTALVFARQSHGLPVLAKEMIWFQVLRQVNSWQPRFPGAAGYDRSRAEALMRMGRGG